MTLTVSEHSNPAQALLRRIKLIAPSMGYWRGSYQLKGAQVTLKGHTLEDSKTTRPQLKILEQTESLVTYRKLFNELATQMNNIKNFYGEDFPSIEGVRQVPIPAVGPMLYEIIGKINAAGKPMFDPDRFVPRTGATTQSVAYRLACIADQFCAEWPVMREELIAKLEPSVWRNVEARVPAASRMREKFYVDVAMIELATGSEAAEAVVDHLQNGAANDDATRYVQASMQRQVDSAIEQLVQGPRVALAEALRNLNELINRDGNVTDRSFNAVREAITKLRMFDFAANRDMLDQVSRLERRLGQTVANTLSSDTAGSNGFLELTNAVIKAAEDDIAVSNDIAKFGRARRAVAL